MVPSIRAKVTRLIERKSNSVEENYKSFLDDKLELVFEESPEWLTDGENLSDIFKRRRPEEFREEMDLYYGELYHSNEDIVEIECGKRFVYSMGVLDGALKIASDVEKKIKDGALAAMMVEEALNDELEDNSRYITIS